MSLVEELQCVNDAFNAAIDRGDASAAAAHFTANAICTAPNEPIIHGTAELTDWFQSWIDAGLKNSRDRDFVAETEGNLAHMTCSYSVEQHKLEHGVLVEHGKALQVFKRDERGAWKIHRFALSIDFSD